MTMQADGVDVKLRCRRLVDSNAAGLMLLRLGNRDVQDTVVEAGRDSILVDTAREAESAGELANGALRDPELLLGLLVLVLVLLGVLIVLLGNSALLLGLVLGMLLGIILDRDLVGLVVMLAALGNSAARLGITVLKVAGRRSAGLVAALDVAGDDDGLRVGELNVDILAIDAWQLAVQLVRVLRLADVELWVEGAGADTPTLAAVGVRGTLDFAAIVVEVVEETEERGEAWVSAIEGTREERHFGWCCCGE